MSRGPRPAPSSDPAERRRPFVEAEREVDRTISIGIACRRDVYSKGVTCLTLRERPEEAVCIGRIDAPAAVHRTEAPVHEQLRLAFK